MNGRTMRGVQGGNFDGGDGEGGGGGLRVGEGRGRVEGVKGGRAGSRSTRVLLKDILADGLSR